MSQPTRSFPAFDDWEKMSETEQDALLDKLETAKQRGTLFRRIAIGALFLAICAAAGWARLAMRP